MSPLLHQLPLRLVVAALVASTWGLVARDPGLGIAILCCASLATASREPECFPPKMERALVVGVTLAVVRLYASRLAGG